MEISMFLELSENEQYSVYAGGFWDIVCDVVVGGVAGAIVGFAKGFVVGAVVGLAAGPGGVIAGALSCGGYYAAKGAVIGAGTNAIFQQLTELEPVK